MMGKEHLLWLLSPYYLVPVFKTRFPLLGYIINIKYTIEYTETKQPAAHKGIQRVGILFLLLRE
jgi:hypothetical protein